MHLVCLAMQSGYIAEVLGRPAQPLSEKPAHAVVIAREWQSLGSDDSRCEFDVVLTGPSLGISEEDLLQVIWPPRLQCLPSPAGCRGRRLCIMCQLADSFMLCCDLCSISMSLTLMRGAQAVGADKSRLEGLRAWLVSRDLFRLQLEAKQNNGCLVATLDGQQVSLQLGKHFTLPSNGSLY
jgi:hypothetical protein